jgi:lipopolysaccharide/colanic/teichoic acid biosynthesis glycosyltransferase
MKKRLLFHFFHFMILNALIFLAVYLYFVLLLPPGYVLYNVVTAYKFILKRLYNFLLVSFLTYFLIYVTGIMKYTIEEKFFRFVGYLREVFKVFLILAIASFVEYFVFYQNRIGRLIYVFIFIQYGIYYYIYRAIRSDKGPRLLLWLASVPAETILKKYLEKQKPGTFRIFTENSVPEDAGPDLDVVYQDGSIDEYTSEALIKNKLAGHTVVELVELVEKETGKIPLDFVSIHWFLEKFDVVDRNYFRSSRMFNIFMSVILFVLLFPFGIILAFIHKLFSKGPIFFVQERVGLHGHPFKLIKFRTMVKEAEKHGAQFTEKDDWRITPIGKFMRRFRLDEIPQLINVLKGDMSMVGPRPEREVFIESLAKEIPYYKLRLLVPPGLTGWAQTNSAYAGKNIEDHKEKLEYDLYYIKNRSIFMDLLVLLITAKAIIQGKGE